MIGCLSVSTLLLQHNVVCIPNCTKNNNIKKFLSIFHDLVSPDEQQSHDMYKVISCEMMCQLVDASAGSEDLWVSKCCVTGSDWESCMVWSRRDAPPLFDPLGSFYLRSGAG